ncbi:MAG TPA: protein TolR [Elusimicrobia bacterium]|nr:protein TolR [Elusimicrobiota bacterium]HBT60153.1 protein TolR [Elusimicrobiota bacterium]
MVQVDLGDEDIISEINLTPLVDVSLVLVIIFMVVAPFFSQILKPLLLPASSRATLSEQNCVKVSIFPDGTLAVGAALIAEAKLAEALQLELTLGKRPWALVRAGTDVSSGRVMDIVKELKRAGIERIAFAAQPKAIESPGPAEAAQRTP